MIPRRFFEPERPDPASLATRLLNGTQPNEDDSGEGREIARGTLLQFSGWVLVAAVVAWLTIYSSGIFPYLGQYSYSWTNGARTEHALGTHQMLLFKGQEAFINYKIDSPANRRGDVYLDIQPWPAGDWTPAMKTIRGKTEGKIQVAVTKTGVYRFQHRTGPSAYRENLSYTVTWGAD